MANETYQDSFGRWRRLSTAVVANADDLPHLVGRAQRLILVLDEVEGAVTEQAVHTASKQEVSQQIKGLVARGRTIASFLVTGIREHYGKGSEKLAEFKIQPRRGGQGQVVVEPPAPEIAQVGTEGEPQTDPETLPKQ